MGGLKCKTLFRGVFNFKRELTVVYRAAYTRRQAWLIFCRVIARKQEISIGMVMNMFPYNDESVQNYQITVETEFREINEELLAWV